MASQSPPIASRRSAFGIHLAIFASFALFAVTMAIIYYFFITTPETDCSLYVYGNEAMDQAVATLEGPPNSAQQDKQSYTVKLERANDYSARFFLPSGTYHLKVVGADGRVLVDNAPFIPPGFRQQFDLSRLMPPPAAASLPPAIR